MSIGRPRVFKGITRFNIGQVLKANGLTKGRKVLASRGINVSMSLAQKIASERGLSFKLGRPSKAA